MNVITVPNEIRCEKPPDYDTVATLMPPSYDDAIKLNPSVFLAASSSNPHRSQPTTTMDGSSPATLQVVTISGVDHSGSLKEESSSSQYVASSGTTSCQPPPPPNYTITTVMPNEVIEVQERCRAPSCIAVMR